MGKFFSCLLTLVAVMLPSVLTSCSDEDGIFDDTYYISDDRKIPLKVIKNKAEVFFYPENEEAIREELSKYNLTLSGVRNYLASSVLLDYYTEDGKKLYENLMKGTINGDYINYRSALKYTVAWSPYYRLDGREAIPYNCFLAKPKAGVEHQQLVRLAKKYGVIIASVEWYDDTLAYYEFACTNESRYNPVRMSIIFYQIGLFEWSEPVLGGKGFLD